MHRALGGNNPGVTYGRCRKSVGSIVAGKKSRFLAVLKHEKIARATASKTTTEHRLVYEENSDYRVLAVWVPRPPAKAKR